MATKRTRDQDPEYDAIPAEIQEKRIRLLEDNVRKQTTKKIETIIKTNFEDEIAKKEAEIDSLDEALHEARCTMDRLRACIVTKYYATLGQEQVLNEHASSSIHPTIKKYLGKSPRKVNCNSVDNPDSNEAATQGNEAETSHSHDFDFKNKVESNEISEKIWNSNASAVTTAAVDEISTRAARFKRKCKIIVGNVSRFIPVWQRDRNDQSTFKWMVYVRGDKYNPNIGSFVKKVRFLLHPSYRPSDIVEITNPPFELMKRGWGEFKVRVQLHFHDPRNKPVDIFHHLKLDKTYTGLQTLGAETVYELQLFKQDDFRVNSYNSPFSTMSVPVSSLASKNNSSVSVNCNGPTSEESNSSERELNTNVHTVIKKEPNSLILNIKLPKNTTNDVKSDQSSSVNTHKIISTSFPSSSESNTEKKTVPKIVISNNRVTTKPCVTKPATIANGLNTAFVKCKDNEGRVLMLPQSSLTFKAPPNAAKLNNIPQSNADSNSSTVDSNINKTVPSYILKVVSNQDSGQNQFIFIPVSEKKVKAPSIKSPEEIKTEPVDPNDLTSGMHTLSNLQASRKSPSPHIHYEQELENIKLENYKSFVELLKRVCKIFPLVKKGVDHSVFTFCADSLEQFQKWNVGKQRACEWRRAGMVRKSVLNLLNKKGSSCIKPESVWSQSSVMSWLRKNGFVPMATEKVTLLPEPKWSGIELCSLTNADDIVSSLPEEKDNLVISEEDEEIEIVDICNEKKPEICSTESSQEVCHLPHLSDAASFVKHTASQIDVDIKPVELEPQLYIPVIEEMILAACQGLASDLIGSALSEGFDRLGGRICPEEVTVSDVFSAIRKVPQFDFIPNSFLGIPKDSEGNT